MVEERIYFVQFICLNEISLSFKMEFDEYDFESTTMNEFRKKIKDHFEALPYEAKNLQTFFNFSLDSLDDKETIKHYEDCFPINFTISTPVKVARQNMRLLINIWKSNPTVLDLKNAIIASGYEKEEHNFLLKYGGDYLKNKKKLSEYNISKAPSSVVSLIGCEPKLFSIIFPTPGVPMIKMYSLEIKSNIHEKLLEKFNCKDGEIEYTVKGQEIILKKLSRGGIGIARFVGFGFQKKLEVNFQDRISNFSFAIGKKHLRIGLLELDHEKNLDHYFYIPEEQIIEAYNCVCTIQGFPKPNMSKNIDFDPYDTLKTFKEKLKAEGFKNNNYSLALKNNFEIPKDAKFSDVGLTDNSEIIVVTRGFYGLRPQGFTQFCDISDLKKCEERPFYPITDAPEYRKAKPGLNLEGKCKNKNCKAFARTVICPLQPKTKSIFNLIKNTELVKCPLCQFNFQPDTCCFVLCKYSFSGTRLDTNGNEKRYCRQEYETVGRAYRYYDPCQSGKVSWTSLTIFTEVIDENDSAFRPNIISCSICSREVIEEEEQSFNNCEGNHISHTNCLQTSMSVLESCVLCTTISSRRQAID